MRGGGYAGRREEECGEGAGETSSLRYANSREDGVGPSPHRAPNPPSPSEVASERAAGLGVLG